MARQPGELTKIRQKRNLTQADAAELLSVDRSALSRYEDGSRLPSFSVLRSMREAYRVSADALMDAFEAVQLRRRRTRNNGGPR